MVKKCTIFFLVAFITSGLAFSKANRTGSINGVVRTPDGDPFPGVIVLLRSPALIVPEVEAFTDQEGIYRFPGLSPGVYELSFIVRGLETYVQKGIVVKSDITVSLDFELPLRAAKESMVVEGEAPVVGSMRIEGVRVLDNAFLETSPDNGNDDLTETRNNSSFSTSTVDESFLNRCPLKTDALTYLSYLAGFSGLKFQGLPQLGPNEWYTWILMDMELRSALKLGISPFTLQTFRDVFKVGNAIPLVFSSRPVSGRIEYDYLYLDYLYLLRMMPERIFQMVDRIEF